MFVKLKQKAGGAALFVIEGLGFVASFASATIVALAGKVMLAVVLFAIALGIFLQLSGRRRETSAPPPSPPPMWTRPASAVLATIEVALLVEATRLPVRFDQPGFEPWHWALVLAALLAAYSLHLRAFRALTRRTQAAAAQS